SRTDPCICDRRVRVVSRLAGVPSRRRPSNYPHRVITLDAIDVTFDFRSDTPSGRDPDTFSPTLISHHRRLCSKPPPRGAPFDLVISGPPYYLCHTSDLGAFRLSSDGTTQTFSRTSEIATIVTQVQQNEIDALVRLSFTIGGMTVFPANRVGG